MNLRYVLLLLLFILNFSATVLADSSHFDLPTLTHDTMDHTTHFNDTNSMDDSEEDCADHECCHHNHIHYYLLPTLTFSPGSASAVYKFPEYFNTPASNVLEITKPPKV